MQLERKSEEQFEKAVDKMAQEQQRATDRALSTLTTANQEHIDASSKKLESQMAHFQRQGNTQLETFGMQGETMLRQMAQQVMTDQKEYFGTLQRELESKMRKLDKLADEVSPYQAYY